MVKHNVSQAEYSVVDEGILSLAEQMGVRSSRDSASPSAKSDQEFDIQSASEWPGVKADRVLLSPVQCRQLWRQFTSDSAFVVQQAQATQVLILLHITYTSADRSRKGLKLLKLDKMMSLLSDLFCRYWL